MHGGMRDLASKLAKEGPVVAKKSVVSRAIARQYDVACAFALDDLSAQLPKVVVGETGFPSLSARGRKLQELHNRELNR